MAFSADLGISDQPTHDVFDWIHLAAGEGLALYQTSQGIPSAVTADGVRPIPTTNPNANIAAILSKPWSVALIVVAILAIVFFLYRMK